MYASSKVNKMGKIAFIFKMYKLRWFGISGGEPMSAQISASVTLRIYCFVLGIPH